MNVVKLITGYTALWLSAASFLKPTTCTRTHTSEQHVDRGARGDHTEEDLRGNIPEVDKSLLDEATNDLAAWRNEFKALVLRRVDSDSSATSGGFQKIEKSDCVENCNLSPTGNSSSSLQGIATSTSPPPASASCYIDLEKEYEQLKQAGDKLANHLEIFLKASSLVPESAKQPTSPLIATADAILEDLAEFTSLSFEQQFWHACQTRNLLSEELNDFVRAYAKALIDRDIKQEQEALKTDLETLDSYKEEREELLQDHVSNAPSGQIQNLSALALQREESDDYSDISGDEMIDKYEREEGQFVDRIDRLDKKITVLRQRSEQDNQHFERYRTSESTSAKEDQSTHVRILDEEDLLARLIADASPSNISIEHINADRLNMVTPPLEDNADNTTRVSEWLTSSDIDVSIAEEDTS